jgi:uncharacterized protein YjiS (DUF1127 family)
MEMIMSAQQFPMSDDMSNPADSFAQKGALLSALGSIERMARAYLAGYVRQRAIRRAEAQLNGLDDRMLRDIGLSRSEIHAAVRRTEREFLLSAQPR